MTTTTATTEVDTIVCAACGLSQEECNECQHEDCYSVHAPAMCECAVEFYDGYCLYTRKVSDLYLCDEHTPRCGCPECDPDAARDAMLDAALDNYL